jgi:hypothetical protein
MDNERKLTPCFWTVTLCAPTCSTAFKIAVSSFFTTGLFLDRSPRFYDVKSAAMLGFTFMAKEGKSNAPMLKIKKLMNEEKKCGKRQFLLQYQKRYVDLRITNNSSNNFRSFCKFSPKTRHLKSFFLMTFLMTSRRKKQGIRYENKNRRHPISHKILP